MPKTQILFVDDKPDQRKFFDLDFGLIDFDFSLSYQNDNVLFNQNRNVLN